MKKLTACLVIAACGIRTAPLAIQCQDDTACPEEAECLSGWCFGPTDINVTVVVNSPNEGEAEAEAESESESESEGEEPLCEITEQDRLFCVGQNWVGVCADFPSEVVCEVFKDGSHELYCRPVPMDDRYGDERCDGLDNDCDGTADEDTYCAACPGGPYMPYYQDADGDGFGNPGGSEIMCSGVGAEGWVDIAGDCDDTNADVHPGYTNTELYPGFELHELCDYLDNDCDGEVDEDFREPSSGCHRGENACRIYGTMECQPDGNIECVNDAGAVIPEPKKCAQTVLTNRSKLTIVVLVHTFRNSAERGKDQSDRNI